MIDLLNRIKKLVKSLRIQLKKWIKQQVKFKESLDQDKKENMLNKKRTKNKKIKINMIDLMSRIKK